MTHDQAELAEQKALEAIQARHEHDEVVELTGWRLQIHRDRGILLGLIKRMGIPARKELQPYE